MSFVTPATPRGRSQRQRAIRNSVGTLSDVAADMADMADNIIDLYHEASESQIERGKAWYWQANGIANNLAREHALSLEQACGILAALSPSTDWERNVSLAFTLAETGDCSHAYGDAIRKARLIRDNPDSDPLLFIGGRKVRSFYHSVYWAGINSHVVVDRHAHAIALGMRKPLGDWAAKALDAPGRYQVVAAAYRAAARRAGIDPSEMQAVTWLVFRETYAGRDGRGYGRTIDEEF